MLSAASGSTGPDGANDRSMAIVTSSYAGDLARFAVLCETVDRFVSGYTRHLVLVADKDVAAFQPFASARREIIAESDLLPSWLRRFSDPLSGFRRDVWLGPWVWPMRGWHVQQLRRLAIAGHLTEAAYLSLDSDVAFVSDYDVADNWRDGRLRLYRLDKALDAEGMDEQRRWSANAGKRLGLATPSRHDYINTLIAWRTATVRAALDRLSSVSGRHWVAALGRDRTFSECMIYGRIADDIESGAFHVPDGRAFCRVYWNGPALDEAGLCDFIAARQPHQVAIGLQSFTGTDVGVIRRAIAGIARQSGVRSD
jgi:hypothetical protein